MRMRWKGRTCRRMATPFVRAKNKCSHACYVSSVLFTREPSSPPQWEKKKDRKEIRRKIQSFFLLSVGFNDSRRSTCFLFQNFSRMPLREIELHVLSLQYVVMVHITVGIRGTMLRTWCRTQSVFRISAREIIWHTCLSRTAFYNRVRMRGRFLCEIILLLPSLSVSFSCSFFLLQSFS